MKKTFRKSALTLVVTISILLNSSGLGAFKAAAFAAGISQEQVDQIVKPLIDMLSDKKVKLKELAALDPELEKAYKIFDEVTKNTRSLDFEYDQGSPEMAYYTMTPTISDPLHRTVSLGQSFFREAAFDQNLNQQEIASGRAAIIIHEGIHSRQGFLSKLGNNSKVLFEKLFLSGIVDRDVSAIDSNEKDAYKKEYIALKLLGTSNTNSEFTSTTFTIKTLMGLSLDSVEEEYKLKEALCLLSGGIDQAFERLMKIAPEMPDGVNTNFRFAAELRDENNFPLYIPLRISDSETKEDVITMKTPDEKAISYSDYISAIPFYKKIDANKVYNVKVVTIDSSNGTANLGRSILLTLKGSDFLNKGSFPMTKDETGSYTINLGKWVFDTRNGTNKVIKVNVKESTGRTLGKLGISTIGNSISLNPDNTSISLDKSYKGKGALKVSTRVESGDTITNDVIIRYVLLGSQPLVDLVVATFKISKEAQDILQNSQSTEELRKAAQQFMLDNLNNAFNKALSANGISDGTNPDAHSLAEYQEFRDYREGSGLTSEQLDKLKAEQETTATSAYNKILEQIKAYQSQLVTIKEAISGVNVTEDIKYARPYTYVSTKTYDREYDQIMDIYTNTIAQYDKIIKIYQEVSSSLEPFYNNQDLWLTLARYSDLSDFCRNVQSVDTQDLTNSQDIEALKMTLDNLIRNKDLSIDSYQQQLYEAKKRDDEKEEKKIEAQNFMNNATSLVEVQETIYNQYKDVNPNFLVDKFATISTRLKEYMNWREGKQNAQSGWGVNFTVTSLHEDIHQFFQEAMKMKSFNGIQAANSQTSTDEKTLINHINVIRSNLEELLKMAYLTYDFYTRCGQVRGYTDSADSFRPDFYDNQISILDKRVSDINNLNVFGNLDILIQAVKDFSEYGGKLTGNTTNIAIPTSSQNDIKIDVNGKLVSSDVAPKIVSGRTMVPVRVAAESLNFKVEWRPTDNTVIISSPNMTSMIPPLGDGKIRLSIDGRIISTDVPPMNESGRILVPIRAIAENLGCKVEWDAANRKVSIKKQ